MSGLESSRHHSAKRHSAIVELMTETIVGLKENLVINPLSLEEVPNLRNNSLDGEITLQIICSWAAFFFIM